jgi:nitroimidazol reductase NimA-like FMN-containing flavoprotein (pyridoxamine 5'-phosphate oxidase superfamily)
MPGDFQENSTMLEEMKRLLKEKDMCVLATVSGSRPHCSLMAYATDEDCREIYMATQKQTQKYSNLTANPSVSLLVDTREEHPGSRRPEARALTVTGVFLQTEDEVRKISARKRLLDRHPHLREFLDTPDTVIFGIRITSFLLLQGIMEAHFQAV